VAALVGGGDDTREAAATQDEPSVTESTTPVTPTGPGSTVDPDPDPGVGPDPGPDLGGGETRPRVVTARLAAADGGCLATDVTVVPSVAASARSGSDVEIALSFATTDETACWIELSPEVFTLKVSTGGVRVWETDQCPGAVPDRTVVLRPGWTTAVSVSWPGIYGDKNCTGTTRDAPPGAYAVEAAIFEGEPGRVDFELQPPADPRPDPQDTTGDETGDGPNSDTDDQADGAAPGAATDEAGGQT